MGLEIVGFISDLVTTNPTGADDRSTSDDHHRVIKTALQNSFPNINGAVTASLAEINKLDGLQATQTELDFLAGRTLAGTGNVIDNFATGTAMLFQQSTAPSGWTKLTVHNDKALRIVTGTAGDGGITNFSTVFTRSETDGHALTVAELATHSHGISPPVAGNVDGSNNLVGGNGGSVLVSGTQNTGSGDAHVHAIDIRVKYVDAILASKD